MTWLMDNQRPIAVTATDAAASSRTIYPKVDDEATIVVEYPKAQGIIQASWNWPFSRKDFEVYGERGYAVATGGDGLRVRLPEGTGARRHARARCRPTNATPSRTSSRSSRGKRKPNALSSLENNMIVTEILEAARESAKTRARVELPRK